LPWNAAECQNKYSVLRLILESIMQIIMQIFSSI